MGPSAENWPHDQLASSREAKRRRDRMPMQRSADDWSTYQLTEFMAMVSASTDEASAVHETVERAAATRPARAPSRGAARGRARLPSRPPADDWPPSRLPGSRGGGPATPAGAGAAHEPAARAAEARGAEAPAHRGPHRPQHHFLA